MRMLYVCIPSLKLPQAESPAPSLSLHFSSDKWKRWTKGTKIHFGFRVLSYVFLSSFTLMSCFHLAMNGDLYELDLINPNHCICIFCRYSQVANDLFLPVNWEQCRTSMWIFVFPQHVGEWRKSVFYLISPEHSYLCALIALLKILLCFCPKLTCSISYMKASH